MNLPTVILSSLIALVFIAIVGRGVYNRRHHKGGCSCGCESCPGRHLCHPEEERQ